MNPNPAGITSRRIASLPPKRIGATVRFLLPDKYRFRQVFFNLLTLPCVALWLYVLIFHVSSFWLAAVLAFAIGLATAFVLALGLFLLGHATVAALDRWWGTNERKQ